MSTNVSQLRAERGCRTVRAEKLNGPARDQSDSLFEQVAGSTFSVAKNFSATIPSGSSARSGRRDVPAPGTQNNRARLWTGFLFLSFGAAAFPQLSVIGVDRSDRQLDLGRERARCWTCELPLRSRQRPGLSHAKIPTSMSLDRFSAFYRASRSAKRRSRKCIGYCGRAAAVSSRNRATLFAPRCRCSRCGCWRARPHSHNGYREPAKRSALPGARISAAFRDATVARMQELAGRPLSVRRSARRHDAIRVRRRQHG